uniref:Radical SAM protein n=1 Tax=Archaeoglobus fulgidus TaxID=2234 RepID=A0A7J2TKC0_ARCFL
MLVLRRKVRKAIGRSKLPELDYTVNPYIGCAHGCIYCYARLYCEKDIADNWGKIVVVKENICEILSRELRNLRRGIVALSTATDAYQLLEEKEKLTRKILGILLENGFRVSIQTKSPLVLRDIDILVENAEMVDVGFTITTLRDDLAKEIEPNAPLPSERAKALKKISMEGIRTWIFLGPIIPGENFEEIVELAKETESHLYYDKYRIKPFMTSGLARELAEKARKFDWYGEFRKIKSYCESLGVSAKPAFDSF